MSMTLSINQATIDEALIAHVRSQMPGLPEETPISVKLRATRGAGGYTAEITVGEETSKNLGAGRKVAAAKRQKAATAAATKTAAEPAPVTETPAAEPAPAPEPAAEPAPAETEAEPAKEEAEADAPAKPTNSIFGNLSKPTNEAAEG